MKEIVLGIDIGGTYTKFGFVSPEGEMFFENSVATGKNKNIEIFISDLYNLIFPELKK